MAWSGIDARRTLKSLMSQDKGSENSGSERQDQELHKVINAYLIGTSLASLYSVMGNDFERHHLIK